MFRRLMLLNVVLFGVLALGVIRLRHDVQAFSASHSVDQIQPESDKPLPKPIAPTAASARQDWPDIAAHNPFSFDRNDVAIVVTPPAPQQPKRPKPVLFGTMVIGKDLIALLAPADSTAQSSRPVRTGETFDGWTIIEIQDQTVTVAAGDVKESLILADPAARGFRDYNGRTGSSALAAPPVVTVAPVTAPVTTAPAAAPNSFAPQTTTVSPTGKKQILVHTPFGDKIMDDPSQ
jgi:hypothetical protein